MQILFIGDIVGEPGRRVTRRALKKMKRAGEPDLVIANGENAAGGAGITPEIARELLATGVDVLTGGNHTWDKREILPFLDENDRILRPANYPEGTPGSGVCLATARTGETVVVVNLMGRVFMTPIEDPFRCADRILDEIGEDTGTVIVDMHGEATSEKIAMARYLDGRVTAVLGTHTHVPTADARILPGGTGAVTDVGMTGVPDSILGVDADLVLTRFLTQRPVRFKPAAGTAVLCGILLETTDNGRRTARIRRFEYREEDGDPA
jgi:metallophosphoesterase (TIGR00282 family)